MRGVRPVALGRQRGVPLAQLDMYSLVYSPGSAGIPVIHPAGRHLKQRRRWGYHSQILAICDIWERAEVSFLGGLVMFKSIHEQF